MHLLAFSEMPQVFAMPPSAQMRRAKTGIPVCGLIGIGRGDSLLMPIPYSDVAAHFVLAAVVLAASAELD